MDGRIACPLLYSSSDTSVFIAGKPCAAFPCNRTHYTDPGVYFASFASFASFAHTAYIAYVAYAAYTTVGLIRTKKKEIYRNIWEYKDIEKKKTMVLPTIRKIL